MNKLLILDRDGVVNIEYGHVYKEEDFKFMPGIFDFCNKYLENGYEIVICSNQSGIAKGVFTLEQYRNINYYMLEQFEAHQVHISKTYVCPHCDADHCNCHKPKPGMILDAIHDFNADKEECVGVGDKMSDMQAYHDAGIKKLIFLKGENPVKKADFSFDIISSL